MSNLSAALEKRLSKLSMGDSAELEVHQPALTALFSTMTAKLLSVPRNERTALLTRWSIYVNDGLLPVGEIIDAIKRVGTEDYA